jgi:hypothetical protein
VLDHCSVDEIRAIVGHTSGQYQGYFEEWWVYVCVECWMKMLVQMLASARVLSPVSGDITSHSLKWQTSKLIHRITKKCRGPQKILQSGHLLEQKVHTDECLVAKHHESRESLDVNCGRMTMEELASFVLDKHVIFWKKLVWL